MQWEVCPLIRRHISPALLPPQDRVLHAIRGALLLHAVVHPRGRRPRLAEIPVVPLQLQLLPDLHDRKGHTVPFLGLSYIILCCQGVPATAPAARELELGLGDGEQGMGRWSGEF